MATLREVIEEKASRGVKDVRVATVLDLLKREQTEAPAPRRNGGGRRPKKLDVVGTAEAAEQILHVERARIGKWRRKGILLSNGERIKFPEPIMMVTTAAKHDEGPQAGEPDHSKLAATPLWWADDIRALRARLDEHKPRD